MADERDDIAARVLISYTGGVVFYYEGAGNESNADIDSDDGGGGDPRCRLLFAVSRECRCDNFLIKPLCVIAQAFIADETGRRRQEGTRDRGRTRRTRASGAESEVGGGGGGGGKGAGHLVPSSPASLPPGM